MKPLVIDLYAGRGGWSRGFIAEGFRAVGFDIERHACYPGQLVLQDVLTLDGAQFRDAACIVGSSPCQEFSYRAMPWKRAKALPPPYKGIELFEAQFRIQREASKAAGRHIPMVVENVKGAQPWVGRAAWHYGSYYLWGGVPALMPFSRSSATKLPGENWSRFAESGEKSPHWSMQAINGGVKGGNGTLFNVAHGQRVPGDNAGCPVRGMNEYATAGIKQHGSGSVWFDTGIASVSSHGSARKAASAMIAEIPFDLAQHIARCYHPRNAPQEATA